MFRKTIATLFITFCVVGLSTQSQAGSDKIEKLAGKINRIQKEAVIAPKTVKKPVVNTVKARQAVAAKQQKIINNSASAAVAARNTAIRNSLIREQQAKAAFAVQLAERAAENAAKQAAAKQVKQLKSRPANKLLIK